IWARQSFRAAALPFLSRASNCVRSSSVNSTTYFFAIAFLSRSYFTWRRFAHQNPCDGVLQQIAAHERSAWQVLSGGTRQSIAENTMCRFKRLFGGLLWARSLETPRTEAVVKCEALNRMTPLGMPEAVRGG